MAARRVAVIVGSIREGAVSRRVANALRAMAPAGLAMELVEIRELPHYNQELENDNAPASWKKFRDALRDVDGVMFVTPEYNRGVPGPLKNAVDVGSRPWGKAVWEGKPVAIVSTSPGPLGGYGANHQLRQNLSYFNIRMLHQPEMYITFADKAVDAGGKVTDDKAREVFANFLAAFARWIEQCQGAKGA